MNRRAKDTYNTSGLKCFSAPDTSGGTVHVQAFVPPEVKALLQEQPEGVSYHIRQALIPYCEQLRHKTDV